MPKINFISLFIFFSLLSLLAQTPSDVSVFEIKKIKLQTVEYPWGAELGLLISGNASAVLSESCLLVTIFYSNVKIKDLDLFLPKASSEDSSFAFEKLWEPIHSAYQIAPAGEYSIVVKLSLQEQTQKWKEAWYSKYKEKTPHSYEGTVFLGTKETLEKQRAEHKAFYIQAIKNLNEIYRELHQKTHQAKAQKPFQPNLWLGWFQGSFLESVETEKVKLEQHKNKHFALLYPKTFHALYQYVDVLVRMARFNAIHIYQYHGRNREIEHLKNIDFFGMRSFDEYRI